jgi:hypothetical protein
LNWGASYVVHDCYRRFIRPEGGEKELVLVGRVATVLLMIMAGALALVMETARDNFDIMLQVGAGTGLIFILRWFWWRINAYSELTAMAVSFPVAVYLRFLHVKFGFEPINGDVQLVLTVAITTAAWVAVTLLTAPTDENTLRKFCTLIRPGGPGWKHFVEQLPEGGDANTAWQVPQGILCMLLGCVSIYSTLFATGYWLYGRYGLAMFLSVVAVIAAVMLARQWRVLIQT